MQLNNLSPFQQAPTLGGECYSSPSPKTSCAKPKRFNGHPPLGVNATSSPLPKSFLDWTSTTFQRAPTLGGECYLKALFSAISITCLFQRAPTLGGECYRKQARAFVKQYRNF